MSETRSGRGLLFGLLGAVVVVAAIAVLAVVSQSTLHVSQTARSLADDEMNAVRQRFAPAQPCLERPESTEPAPPTAPGAPIKDVHMLAWNPSDRFVRATTPYWALRASAWKIRLVRDAVPVLQYVTLADLERCGRGVLIDRTTDLGGRVVIWAD